MDPQSIFLTALEQTNPEAQAAWLDEACGGDESLKQHICELLERHRDAEDFLETPPAELHATVVEDSFGGNRAASLQAGLASAFSDDEAVVLGSPAHSVLKLLGQTIELPRVVLREEAAEGVEPIVRPRSSEMPERDTNGRYQLLGEIARGGMGAILKGRDTDLGRDLAIKVLLEEHRTRPEVIQRFVEEAQIGGQLQHPGIAPVYELGQFADRRPFFSMKLVKGETLSKQLAERAHPSEDRGRLLGVFEQVCQTMAYAHSRGVIHRDLKPANIMVGSFGEVQVMDWGLAKVLPEGGVADERKAQRRTLDRSLIQTLRSGVGSDAPATTGAAGSHTKMGSVMGTPAYMPPEQALGEIANLDERADVFGLGAILCEILTGQPPYVAANVTQTYRLACRGKLGDCFERLATCGADADLISLTKHCLELEPQDRPRDAGVLAHRVADYLESVESKLRQAELESAAEAARADAQAKHADAERQRADAESRRAEAERQRAETESLRLEQQRQAARKLRKVLVGLASAAILAGVACGAALLANLRANALAAVALGNEAAAKASAKTAQKQREAALSAQQEAIAQKNRADHEAAMTQQNLYYAQMHLALQAWREHRGLGYMHSLLANWGRDETLPFRRQWEWFYINALPYQNLRTLPKGGIVDRQCSVAWHAASGRLAEGGVDGVIRIWDVQGERIALILRGPQQVDQFWGRTWFAWSPDGSRLAACGADGTVHLWDIGPEKKHAIFTTHDTIVRSVTFDPHGTRVLACGQDGKVKIVDTQTGEVSLGVAHADAVAAVAWTTDAQRVAMGYFDGTVTVSDVQAGAEVAKLQAHPDSIYALAWSPDQSRLATTSANQFFVRIWDLATEQQVFEPLRHSHAIFCLAWSSDGRRLATGSVDETAKIWNMSHGQEEATLRGHVDTVYSIAWGPENRSLASGGFDGSVRVWTSVGDQEAFVLPGETRMTAVAWSPDGERLASGSDDGIVRIWDPAHPDAVVSLTRKSNDRPFDLQFGLVHKLAWSPDGKRLAAASTDGAVSVWSLESGENEEILLAGTGPAWCVAWSPTGDDLAAGFENGTIHILEGAKQGPGARAFRAHESRVLAVAWSPQGDRLASGGYTDAVVRVWDPLLGTQVGALRGHSGGVMGLAWSPDGKQLASSSGDRNVRTWDASTGQAMFTMPGHHDYVNAVVWSPDGSRLASAGFDNSVRVWDPATGAEACMLRGVNGFFHDVSWNGDGARLAAACSDGQAWIWDATQGFERDATPRALPFIDRAVAAGVGRGDDLRWYVDSYVRAGRLEQALAAAKDDPAALSYLAMAARDRGRSDIADNAYDRALAALELQLQAEPRDEGAALELADLLLTAGADDWTVLRPRDAQSQQGAMLTLQGDGSLLASESSIEADVYTISVDCDLDRIAAVRLEALPDPSLPQGGPGRHPSGNFQLRAVRLMHGPSASEGTPTSAPFASAWASYDYKAPDADIAGVVDERLHKVWHVWGRTGEAHQAVFRLLEPLATEGRVLTMELDQNFPLGRLRLSVAADAQSIEDAQVRFRAKQLAEPWAKLAAAYQLAGDEAASTAVIERHPDAVAGVAELYAAAQAWELAIAAYSAAISGEVARADLLVKRAEAYAGAQQWELAAADWRRAVELEPEMLSRAFDAFRLAGRWEEAADWGMELVEQHPDDSQRWIGVAPVIALSSDEAQYVAFCKRLVAQPAETAIPADRCIKACLLRPGAIDMAALPTEVLARELDEGTAPSEYLPYFWACRALSAFRAGEAELAVQYVAQSETHNSILVVRAMNEAVLALSHQTLQHPDEARTALAAAADALARLRAIPDIKGHPDLLIAEILFREAEAKASE